MIQYNKYMGSVDANVQEVIRKLVDDACVDTDVMNTSVTREYERLTGRNFIHRIPVPEHSKKGKRSEHETRYEYC